MTVSTKKFYKLRNCGSGLYLKTKSSSLFAGANGVQNTNESENDNIYIWYFESVDEANNVFRIKNKKSGLELAIEGCSKDNGKAIEQRLNKQSDDNYSFYNWVIAEYEQGSGKYYIKNNKTNYYMIPDSLSNKTNTTIKQSKLLNSKKKGVSSLAEADKHFFWELVESETASQVLNYNNFKTNSTNYAVDIATEVLSAISVDFFSLSAVAALFAEEDDTYENMVNSILKGVQGIISDAFNEDNVNDAVADLNLAAANLTTYVNMCEDDNISNEVLMKKIEEIMATNLKGLKELETKTEVLSVGFLAYTAGVTNHLHLMYEQARLYHQIHGLTQNSYPVKDAKTFLKEFIEKTRAVYEDYMVAKRPDYLKKYTDYPGHMPDPSPYGSSSLKDFVQDKYIDDKTDYYWSNRQDYIKHVFNVLSISLGKPEDLLEAWEGILGKIEDFSWYDAIVNSSQASNKSKSKVVQTNSYAKAA